MNQMKSNSFDINRIYYQVARTLVIISTLLAIILSILLIANYWQTKISPPLTNPALQKMFERLDNNPEDMALKENIRALDLLARKAYFTRQWQIKFGGYLLFFSVIILLVSIKIMQNSAKQLPEFKKANDLDIFWKMNSMTRKIILWSGGILVGLAIIVGLLSHNQLGTEVVMATPALPNPEEMTKNWPSFRGPGGIGIAHYTNAPTSWNVETGENIRWKTEIPLPGHSSPVIWENRIFLTGGDKNSRELFCYDTEKGELLWQKAVKNIPGSPATIKVDEGTGYAAPTVATNGQFVFAIFPTADVVGFDFSGNQRWGKNLGVPDNHYGFSSSLIAHQNLVFVQFDNHENSRLFAMDAATGKNIWEVERGTISWASPILVNTGERMELILANSKDVSSYDPKTGTQFWRIECLSGEVGPSPGYADGVVYVGNEYANGVAIQINKPGSDPPAQILWEWDEALPNTSSPVATNQFMFFATSDGLISCLNSKTGELFWDHEFDDGFYSSLIIAGDRVYAHDLKGNMHIFKLAETFSAIGDFSLGEAATATPAFLDGQIYIRSEKTLFCIGEK
ncbi:PQQ-binding-like beta-propeller repeat protein [candidate division KSB1 bacterium]|nr:PQQ-binding-like beta-propeller repeat protein [candidate division KSB1 bacterium]